MAKKDSSRTAETLLSKIPYKETKIVKELLVTLGTLIPFMIFIWRNSPLSIVATGIISGLLALLVFESVFLLNYWRQVNEFESRNSNTETQAFLEQLAMYQFIDYDEDIIDRDHRYKCIKTVFSFQDDSNMMNVTLTGVNTSNKPTEYIQEKVADDSPLLTKEMDFKTSQNGDNLKYEFIEDNVYEKVIRIWFNAPVKPGEEFEVQYSCNFSNPSRKEEYLFFPTSQYKCGVEQLAGEVFLENKPNRRKLYKLQHTDDQNKSQIKDPEVPDISTTDDDGVKIYFEKENPGDLYILQFTRDLSSS